MVFFLALCFIENQDKGVAKLACLFLMFSGVWHLFAALCLKNGGGGFQSLFRPSFTPLFPLCSKLVMFIR